ncbi:MAG: hypothetical protein HQ518_10710 [Rhodopirellula sp.]|nr:hypothetical protein [Rhodopirellula sp.]
MADSLETVFLASAASLLGAGNLLREDRSARRSNEAEVERSRVQLLAGQLQSRRTVGFFSGFCVATAFVFLGSLAGSSSLETIRTTLQESYRPERADLLVGDGSVLGVTAIVLLFAGCASAFGLFPMHGVVLNGFESSHASIAATTAVLQRFQASIVLWKVTVVAMPGFESTIQLMCIVFGTASCLSGSILACRGESLRGLAGNLWMTWGGVVLVAAATGMTSQPPAVSETLWQFPSGLATALFSLLISSFAMCLLLTCERWLFSGAQSADFPEDVTGLGRQHGVVAFAVGCSLLTLSVVPPLPGFWCAVFITGNAFLPGVESAEGAALIPEASVLTALLLLLISMLIVAARSVHFLSLMFHHEPIRRFDIRDGKFPAIASLTIAGVLLWIGINVGTALTWFHRLLL